MPKFFNSDMADFAHQLALSPRRFRVEQISRVDALLGLVEIDRAYPFDFVSFKITGYHKRRRATGSSIPGKALLADLVTLAEVISRKASVNVSELPGTYLTHQELADALKVSTKTIRRWRGKGLMGLRVVFEDGVNRLAFLQSTVDRFVKAHADLVAKGASFTQLSAAERDGIVERAKALATDRPLKLHAAARIIAEETGRAVETVRYTLRRHEETHRGEAIFAGHGAGALCERYEAMWRCRQAGESDETIAGAFDCPVDEVEHIFREVQVHQWAQNSWDYVHDELIDAPNADALILDPPEPSGKGAKVPRLPKDLPPYLRSLYLTPLLTAEQERDLFRRYNYVKYKAARALKELDAETITKPAFDDLRGLMDQVETLKQRIISANLRLVVGIAKKHVGWSPSFFEVISDGNVSLMRAVEKFDYTRGFKFSTYATWAIVKNFARSIPEQHYRGTRYVTGQDELLEAAPDHREAPASDSDRRRVGELIRDGLDELNEREREIVSSHFGLGGRSGSLTLEQLGQRFGVTKERIRQIEHRALGRLRELLSPALADVLAD